MNVIISYLMGALIGVLATGGYLSYCNANLQWTKAKVK